MSFRRQPTMVAYCDEQLLTHIESGVGYNSFEELVRRYWAFVHSTCQRQLRAADVDEAVMAVFSLLWEQGRVENRRRPLAAWLHRVARGVCRPLRFANGIRISQETGDATNAPVSREAGYDEALDFLDSEIDKLPDKYRVPLVTFHLAGQSIDHVATMLNLPVERVQTLLERGRARLQTGLQRQSVHLQSSTMLEFLIYVLESAHNQASGPARSGIKAVRSIPHQINCGEPNSKSRSLANNFHDDTRQKIWQRRRITVSLALLTIVGTIGFLFGSAPAGPPRQEFERAATPVELSLHPTKSFFASNEPLTFNAVWQNSSERTVVITNAQDWHRWQLGIPSERLFFTANQYVGPRLKHDILAPGEQLRVPIKLTSDAYMLCRATTSNPRRYHVFDTWRLRRPASQETHSLRELPNGVYQIQIKARMQINTGITRRWLGIRAQGQFCIQTNDP